MSARRWALVVVLGLAMVLGSFLQYQRTLGNARVVAEITENPQGMRASIVMLLGFADGKELPVNYLQEDMTVYVGADGPWWREFTGDPEGVPVSMLIRGKRYQGKARTILDDPEYTREVFARLRPSAPSWLPDWLNGKLIVISIAEPALEADI